MGARAHLGRGQTMNDVTSRRLTGVLLILTPIAFNLLFTLLSVTFEHPDILRQPPGYVLERFDAGGAGLVATWYGFMLTAVLFVPLVVLVHRVLADDGREASALLPRPRHGLRRRCGRDAVPGAGPLAVPGPVPRRLVHRPRLHRSHQGGG